MAKLKTMARAGDCIWQYAVGALRNQKHVGLEPPLCSVFLNSPSAKDAKPILHFKETWLVTIPISKQICEILYSRVETLDLCRIRL